MKRASRLTGMYFHSEATRSSPSRVRDPHTTGPAAGATPQAVDPERVELADLGVGERHGEPGDAGQGGSEPGGSLPHPALGVRAGEDACHRPAGDALLHLVVAQRVWLHEAWEEHRRVLAARAYRQLLAR